MSDSGNVQPPVPLCSRDSDSYRVVTPTDGKKQLCLQLADMVAATPEAELQSHAIDTEAFVDLFLRYIQKDHLSMEWNEIGRPNSELVSYLHSVVLWFC
ncbi:unnamed protein product [Protopolystoma xenopodis]|uniref:Uncharacterized protein n=1 Tax=Protopolystoma xenopodis TaxID=117903 RepID=A0A448WD54_9PLAT|nr:unnamed protein product [Protopolystoma xenopodis]